MISPSSPGPPPASNPHMPFLKFLPALLIALAPATGNAASICFSPHRDSEGGPKAWAFEAGVAVITSNNIEDVLTSFNRETGPAGGEIYSITASRRLGELIWKIGGHTFTPQLEVPLTVAFVDENSGSLFPDLNASFSVRWIDFPWNDYIKTSFAMGLGLSYSTQIYLIDIERHPGEDRSKLKFNWPIQMTFALPAYEKHQLTLFIDHQSGGHIFDEGGVNSVGVGYRHDF